MDGHRGKKSQRLATYSPQAADDLAINHTYTAQKWGYEQAERYTEFLKVAALRAARNPQQGRPLEERPGFFSIFVKWPKAKHGHYVIYKPLETGAYVVRILHSTMNFPEHLEDK
jgi:toxin ParE1/3/4